MEKQQSSLLVTLRGLIMLSCLVVFPYLAITGDSLPEGVQRLIPSEVKSFVQRLSPETPPSPELAENEVAQQLAPSFSLQPVPESAANEAEHFSQFSVPGRIEPPADAVALAPIESQVPAEPSVYVDQASATNELSVADAANTPQSEQIELQLKSLGAVAYHLEEWGSSGDMYRFVCELAVDEHQSCRRHFEAIETTPLLAMQKVLASVESRNTVRPVQNEGVSLVPPPVSSEVPRR